MKSTHLAPLLMLLSLAVSGQIYTAKSSTVSFHSTAPLEDIDAVNRGGVIVLKSSTGDIQVSLTMKSFKFKNALMEEHFNENYIESDKYPKCTFKGKINEPVDYNKDGENKVTVTGKMEIHGVTRDVTLDGVLTKSPEGFTIHSKFPIRVADYNIKVPSMYVKNIAEVVDVTIDAVLEPYQKK
jgi:polyisoprenoid-binding protein YceI